MHIFDYTKEAVYLFVFFGHKTKPLLLVTKIFWRYANLIIAARHILHTIIPLRIIVKRDTWFHKGVFGFCHNILYFYLAIAFERV